MNIKALPLPPFEMRQLVGPTDPAAFDNPDGALVFPEIPVEAQRSIFDFGCGCGRLARQLMQQQPPPERYTGIDLHLGMIHWCAENLMPLAPGFQFHHHDVFHARFNPGDKPPARAFPVGAETFDVVVAWSVFTHIIEQNAAFYLKEVARILGPEGTVVSTWFTFDKTEFPMMQSFQNALYIHAGDPTNAVIYDRAWLQNAVRAAGLSMVSIKPPAVRGYQWTIQMAHRNRGLPELEFPVDQGPAGVVRPPVPPRDKDASRIGIE